MLPNACTSDKWICSGPPKCFYTTTHTSVRLYVVMRFCVDASVYIQLVVCMPVYSSMSSYICLMPVCRHSVCVSVCVSACESVSLSVSLPVFLSVRQSVRLSVYLSIHRFLGGCSWAAFGAENIIHSIQLRLCNFVAANATITEERKSQSFQWAAQMH